MWGRTLPLSSLRHFAFPSLPKPRSTGVCSVRAASSGLLRATHKNAPTPPSLARVPALKASSQTFSTTQSLTIPTERETPSNETHAALFETHKAKLGETLGVASVADLDVLSESDLVQTAGLTVVDSRKLLAATSLTVEEEETNTPKPAAPTPPQAALLALNEVGLSRGERPVDQMLASSFLGGTYLAAGGAMFCLVSGGLLVPGAALAKFLGAAIFPLGLTAIVVTGSDLLTSNMLYATLPFISADPRRTVSEKVANLGKLWAVSGAGNLAASVAIAYATSLVFNNTSVGAFAAALAAKKVAGSTGAIFLKGIAANSLVNLAILQATTASTTPGKMALLWLPITTFVALGMEHSIANFYLLPLGAFCGAPDLTLSAMCHNLAPCILGNAVGATFVIGFLQWHAAKPPPPGHTARGS